LLEPLLQRYLEETGTTLQEIGERNWLGQLFAERGRALDRLKSVRQAIECYLYKRLPDFLEFRQRGRFRHFEFELPTWTPETDEAPRTEKFRLPEFDGDWTTLSCLLEWLEAGEKQQVRRRLSELQVEHQRLCQLYVSGLPELLRQQLLNQITEAENELGRLRAQLARGLAGELRAIYRQLVDLARRVSKARAGLKQEDLGARTRALRRVFDSIVCEFEGYRITGGKVRHRLVRVKFVPLLGEEMGMDVGDRKCAGPRADSCGTRP
jgi:hypothetical protein